jgi:hypothetical protein
MDTDGDSVVPTAGVISHWSDAVETYLSEVGGPVVGGSDTTKPCAAHLAANNEGPLDYWPLDLDDNRVVNGGDWLKAATVINSPTAGGSGRAISVGGEGDGTATRSATIMVVGMGLQWQQRFDFNWDGQVTLGSDLGKFNAYMNKTCGAAGAPPLTINNTGTFQH